LDELGVTSVGVIAENRVAPAQVILPQIAELALHAAQPRTDDCLVSRLAVCHTRAGDFDDACDVASGDVGEGKLDSRKPSALPEIEIIQRAGPDPDHYLPWTGLRFRHIFVAQFLEASMLMETDSLHLGSLPSAFGLQGLPQSRQEGNFI